jgi:hypothetical protein
MSRIDPSRGLVYLTYLIYRDNLPEGQGYAKGMAGLYMASLGLFFVMTLLSIPTVSQHFPI